MPNCASRLRPAISSRLPCTIGATSDADLAVVGAGGGEQLGRRHLDRVGVGDAEPHEASLGLVGDAVAVELDHDRAAERSGGVGGVGRRGHDPLLGHRHPVGGQQPLGRGFGEGPAAGHPGSVVKAPSCVHVITVDAPTGRVRPGGASRAGLTR